MRDSVKETNDTKFWHGLFRSFCLLFIHPWKDDRQNGIKIIGAIYSTTPYHIRRYLPSNLKTKWTIEKCCVLIDSLCIGMLMQISSCLSCLSFAKSHQFTRICNFSFCFVQYLHSVMNEVVSIPLKERQKYITSFFSEGFMDVLTPKLLLNVSDILSCSIQIWSFGQGKTQEDWSSGCTMGYLHHGRSSLFDLFIWFYRLLIDNQLIQNCTGSN